MSNHKVTLEEAKLCVGDGWFPLLKDAYAAAEVYSMHFVQVKEKLGALRMYADHDCSSNDGEELVCEHKIDSFYTIIADLERKSLSICEGCGEKGKLRNDTFWLMTLCTPCNKKRLDKKKERQDEEESKRKEEGLKV